MQNLKDYYLWWGEQIINFIDTAIVIILFGLVILVLSGNVDLICDFFTMQEGY